MKIKYYSCSFIQTMWRFLKCQRGSLFHAYRNNDRCFKNKMSKAKIIFLHPDLGVGGAERLVVDAALALKQKKYSVKFVTSYHNTEHCFDETKNGSLDVTVVGRWIPRSIFGRFFAFFAYLKMIYCAFYIILFENVDCVFCDLVSVQIPILHLCVKKVIFYCHFPDQLLTKQGGLLKKLYRLPLNWMEEKTTGFADKIYVNSSFTKSVYKKTFSSLKNDPVILYPSINVSTFEYFSEEVLNSLNLALPSNSFVFLSINRYERKKNVGLSMSALKNLKEKLSADKWENIFLIIAGGYDDRVAENVEYFNELQALAKTLNVIEKVFFLKSPSDNQKVALLNRCDCLLYTPANEHFGIVPLEAMYSKKPVIAVNSGGPTETIENGVTGFLCDGNELSFSESMLQIVNTMKLREKMGLAGHQRFMNKFSFEAFAEQLDYDILSLLCLHVSKSH